MKTNFLVLVILGVVTVNANAVVVPDFKEGNLLHWGRSPGCKDEKTGEIVVCQCETKKGAMVPCQVKGYRLNYEILDAEAPCIEPLALHYYMDVGDVNSYNLKTDRNFQRHLKYFIKITAYIDDAKYNFQNNSTEMGTTACVTLPETIPINPLLNVQTTSLNGGFPGGQVAEGANLEDKSVYMGTVEPVDVSRNNDGGNAPSPKRNVSGKKNFVSSPQKNNADEDKIINLGRVNLGPGQLSKNPLDVQRAKLEKSENADGSKMTYDSAIIQPEMGQGETLTSSWLREKFLIVIGSFSLLGGILWFMTGVRKPSPSR